MMRVLIADDEAPARDKLRRWLAEQADVEVLADAADGLAAAQAIATLSPDVAFLDIRMPGLSGLEVAAQLEPATAPLVVFVTAYDEHAIKAFELNAADYLLKPYDKDRLIKTLERLRSRQAPAGGGAAAAAAAAVRAARAHTGSSERLLVPQGESLQLIDCSAIHWLQADDNYVHVHTAQSRFMLRRTLADLLAQLGEQRFVRIHKSTVVNLAHIASLEPLFKGDHEIRLRNGAVLRLSRRYKDDLFSRLGR
jgi:two-component system LytT family response regulator